MLTNIYFLEEIEFQGTKVELTFEVTTLAVIKIFQENKEFKFNQNSEINRQVVNIPIDQFRKIKGLYEGRLFSDAAIEEFDDEDMTPLVFDALKLNLLNCSGFTRQYLVQFFDARTRLHINEGQAFPEIQTERFASNESYFFYPVNVHKGNAAFIGPMKVIDKCYFIDFGGDFKDELECITTFAFAQYDKVVILITHWDKDHYDFLRNLTPDEIEKVEIISPFHPRFSNYALETIAFIKLWGGCIHFLGRLIGAYTLGKFSISRRNYRRTAGGGQAYTKNNSGLCFYFENTKSVLFPGDSRYDYIDTYLPDYLNVTHHGSAHCGPLHLNGVAQSGIGILSVPPASNHHPSLFSTNLHIQAGWTLRNCGFSDFV